MNGKFILDTNAIISLLNGHNSINLQLQNATWIGISVISELEFLAYRNLTENDRLLFQNFKSRIHVINLDTNDAQFILSITFIRQRFNLKLPDAIIAASAFENQATLISNDIVFSRVANLAVLTF